MTRDREHRRREIRLPPPGDAWAAGGLAALVVVLFNGILFRGRVLYERDIHIVWHAQVESFVRCIASGSWPVWDPYVSFGRPLLANPATQVLYPWTWLNLIARPAPIYTAYVVAHLILAGIGTFLLARRMELSRPAAFVGAAIWMLSGPLLSMVSVWHHLAGAAWMPWVVLAADGAVRSPSVGRALLWGAAFGAQMLAGSPDMCVMTGAILGVQVAVSLARSPRATTVRLLAGGLLALAFALGLAAALWIPAAENARNTGRWTMAESARTVWSMHPASLLQVLLPLLPGDLPLSPSARVTLFDIPIPFVNSFYLGLPAFALAAAAFVGPRPPWAFGFITLAASILALGRHTAVYAVATQLLPPLRILRYPSKAMVPAAFGFALLCAYGFQAWNRGEGARPRRWILSVLLPTAMGSAVVWGTFYFALHPEAWGRGLLESPRSGLDLGQALGPAVRKVFVAGVLSAATLVLCAAPAWRTRFARATSAAVAVLAVASLLWAHWDLNPTAPAEFYRERPPILDVLKRDGARRVYVFDYLSRVTGKAYRNRIPADIFSAGPSTALEAARALQHYLIPITASRWGLFGSYEADQYSLYSPQLRSLTLVMRAAEETPLHDRLLRMVAVDHVVAMHEEGLETLERIAILPSAFAAPIRVFRVPGAWPRSYVVGGARIGDGAETYRILADPGFDPAREVVLPSGIQIPPPVEAAGTSRIVELRYDRIRMEAELRQPGYLVLSDSYDPGWKATVDGKDVPVLRGNAVFRALSLDAGHHLVEMIYRPPSVTVGAAISAASLLVGLAASAARILGSR